MKKNLVQTLENNKIFKLVLGLGNQDFKEIENLVEIYALAGADMRSSRHGMDSDG